MTKLFKPKFLGKHKFYLAFVIMLLSEAAFSKGPSFWNKQQKQQLNEYQRKSYLWDKQKAARIEQATEGTHTILNSFVKQNKQYLMDQAYKDGKKLLNYLERKDSVAFWVENLKRRAKTEQFRKKHHGKR